MGQRLKKINSIYGLGLAVVCLLHSASETKHFVDSWVLRRASCLFSLGSYGHFHIVSCCCVRADILILYFIRKSCKREISYQIFNECNDKLLQRRVKYLLLY